MLVPLYVLEAFSGSAKREARRVRQLVFTPLHDLEVRGALRRLTGRGGMSALQLEEALRLLDGDLTARRLARMTLDFSRVFERASELSARYASKLLCRSLDVLHVASALELRIERFVSADDRQIALARECGLAATDVTAGKRPDAGGA